MKRMLLALMAALLLALSAGQALAQTPEIEAKMKQAEELREQLASAKAEDYDALLEQYNALGAEIKALMAAQQADAQSKQMAVSEFNDGNKMLRQRNFPAAIQHFQKSSELDPMRPQTFYMLGLSHRYNKGYGEALAAFDKAIQLNSNYVKAYYAKGITLNTMREFGQAVETFKKGVQVQNGAPKDLSDAFTGLGLAYYYQKNYDQAVTSLNRATQLDAQNADAFYNLGKAYGEKSQWQEAADAIKSTVAIEANPKYLTALAEKLNKLGKHQEAAAAAERATGASANYAAAWFELGWARQHLGMKDTAIAAYEKAKNDRTYRQPAQYQIDILNEKF